MTVFFLQSKSPLHKKVIKKVDPSRDREMRNKVIIA